MSKEPLQAIRGMDDVLPVGFSSSVYDSASWVEIKRRYAEWVELHGYRYIETPVVEYTDLFKRTAGETSDIVSKEMYTFEDAGGRSLSLRPEGSASVCRAIVQHGLASSGSTLKFYYTAAMFRAERPQKGRYRQHTQLGLEIFKETEPTADAEAIAILHGFFAKKLGLKDLTVHVNSVGSSACRPAYREALVAFLGARASGLSEDSRRRLETNPMRVLDSKDPQDQEIIAGAPAMLDHLDDECRTHFEGVKDALARVGVPFEINTRLVRGLDYYTKTAFEVTCGSLDGAIKVIGGGGRYDGLVEQIGGPSTPAVGFGSGIERVLLALESQGIKLAEPRVPRVAVLSFDDASRAEAFALAMRMRDAGIEADFAHKARSLTKQLQAVVKAGVRFAVIVGGDEGARGEAVVKDLAGRTQDAVKLDAVLERVKRD